MHQPNEFLRKTLHIAFGLFAVTLRWLPWWAAAGVAGAAVVGNWLLLHRIVGRTVSRHERGWDAGIVLYPFAVAVLIVVFRDRLALAAIAWVVLAFGDGFATVVGKTFRGPALPWNGDKSWSGFLAFVTAGTFGGLAIAIWMQHAINPLHIVIAVVVAAVVESLPLRVDDNVTVPAAAAVALLVLAATPWHPYELPAHAVSWLAVNTLLAAAGWLARSVNLSGAVGGGVLGAIIILAAGWPMYAALLTFFVIGTGATKLGYRRKTSAGLAQEEGGRRGLSHAFANAGVAAICAIAFSRYARSLSPLDLAPIIYLMGIASLATAAADTTASEVGQLAARRAFLPLTFRRVPVGTEGAISVEGTLAGLASGFLVAVVGSFSFQAMSGWDSQRVWMAAALITAAALLGSYIESVAGSWNRKRTEPVPNGVLNFFNTAAGAILFYNLARWVWPIEI